MEQSIPPLGRSYYPPPFMQLQDTGINDNRWLGHFFFFFFIFAHTTINQEAKEQYDRMTLSGSCMCGGIAYAAECMSR